MALLQNLTERVSNLLGSPASGEIRVRLVQRRRTRVSNLLGSPASGEQVVVALGDWDAVFPIYWVPQRVGSAEI